MRAVDSALVDPDARALLGKAATAVDLTVEQLVNLAADAGATVAPPSDGITERFTLEDLGVRMRTALSEVLPKDRPEWFQNLVETQQAALITTLRTRGYSSLVIAEDLGIEVLKVIKIYNRFSDRIGSQVINVRLETIAGQLQLAAERAAEGAKNKGDFSTYWRIHKEMIALLQSLGVVDRAKHKIEVTHNFDDQAKAEIQVMLEIERKKALRLEEMKRANAVEVDPIPDELEDVPALPALPAPNTMKKPYEGD